MNTIKATLNVIQIKMSKTLVKLIKLVFRHDMHKKIYTIKLYRSCASHSKVSGFTFLEISLSDVHIFLY